MPAPEFSTVLSDAERAKQDTRPDAAFYSTPRFVQHVDDGFRKRLTALYRRELDAGMRVLDLMSSWVSHLPDDVSFSHVEGHGLNAEELDANPRLDHSFVQNLNAEPRLPLQDASFGAVLCAVSVQYLQHPESVFAEVARVLRPGGMVIVSFSNRMFPQKAIRAWRTASGSERCALIARYLEAAGGFEAPDVERHTPLVLPVQRFFGSAPDPFYAVVARRSSGSAAPSN
jgi:SAM-dependent methyltransferase